VKITFILPPVDMSGGIKVIAIYAEALQNNGHEVVLISPPPPRLPLYDRFHSLAHGHGWPKYSAHSPSHLDDRNLDHRLLESYRKPTDDDVPDADIIIATWWETAEWINELNASKGARAYFIQHHEVRPYFPVDNDRPSFLLPFHKITISKWLVDVMQNQYGDPVVDCITNSVDFKQFHAPERGKQKRPTVGFMYSHAWFKGIDVSLAALQSVKQRIPDLRVICFGSNKPGEAHPIPDDFEFHFSPAQDSLRDIYAQCDLWLCGSRAEGFHLPPMEAMACRTPVVSTKVGGPMDIIESGVNGELVEVEDVEALADATERVLNLSEEEWLQLSKRSFQTVSNYSWDDAAGQFEQALKHACRRAAADEIAGRCEISA